MKKVIPLIIAVICGVFTLASWLSLRETCNVGFLFCVFLGGFSTLVSVVGFIEEGGLSHE